MKSQIHFNRLLDYRPLDQLSQMTDSDRHALLTEIVGQPPSESAWQAIWELFASWPDGEAKSADLTWADDALASWPDRVRFVYSSNDLLYEGRNLSMLARLVRSIEVYRRDERASAELLAIASSEYVIGLTYLSIQGSEITSRAWQALVESPYLSNLRHLHVTKSSLGAEDVRRVFQSTRFRQLTCLKLIDAGIHPRHLEGVRDATTLGSLCALDLSSNGVGDEGVKILSAAGWLQQIQRLALRDNFIGADAARALLTSPSWERIEKIDLTGNRLSDAEKTSLAALAAKKKIQLVV